MEQLRIDDGRVQVQITNQNGKDLGIIEFNPSDMNLPHRLENGWNKIKAYLDSLKVDVSKVKDDDISEYSRLLHEYDIKIKNELDVIFDTDISRIFGNTNFATFTNSGSSLIENIMVGLLPFIEKKIKDVTDKSNAKISKYTKDYE